MSECSNEVNVEVPKLKTARKPRVVKPKKEVTQDVVQESGDVEKTEAEDPEEFDNLLDDIYRCADGCYFHKVKLTYTNELRNAVHGMRIANDLIEHAKKMFDMFKDHETAINEGKEPKEEFLKDRNKSFPVASCEMPVVEVPKVKAPRKPRVKKVKNEVTADDVVPYGLSPAETLVQ